MPWRTGPARPRICSARMFATWPCPPTAKRRCSRPSTGTRTCTASTWTTGATRWRTKIGHAFALRSEVRTAAGSPSRDLMSNRPRGYHLYSGRTGRQARASGSPCSDCRSAPPHGPSPSTSRTPASTALPLRPAARGSHRQATWGWPSGTGPASSSGPTTGGRRNANGCGWSLSAIRAGRARPRHRAVREMHATERSLWSLKLADTGDAPGGRRQRRRQNAGCLRPTVWGAGCIVIRDGKIVNTIPEGGRSIRPRRRRFAPGRRRRPPTEGLRPAGGPPRGPTPATTRCGTRAFPPTAAGSPSAASWERSPC